LTAKYTTVGERITLFDAVPALPVPPTETDDTAGADLAAIRAQQGFPALVALHLKASAPATITGVRVYKFEKTADAPAGVWTRASVPPNGSVLFSSLDLTTIADTVLLENLGTPERLVIAATVPGGVTVTGYLQRVERS